MTHDQELTAATVSSGELTRVVVADALAPARLVEALGDLVGVDGTIAVRSSGQGSVTNDTGRVGVLPRAQATLNPLARSCVARRGDDARAVLLLAPGRVGTECRSMAGTPRGDRARPRRRAGPR